MSRVLYRSPSGDRVFKTELRQNNDKYGVILRDLSHSSFFDIICKGIVFKFLKTQTFQTGFQSARF